ncbi:MAG: flagellar biosynthetic protein FliO [Ignavibacteriae bacterium]|nr:flagellar biosynthetic protein FliO [Ignavibacteriota bacterium]
MIDDTLLRTFFTLLLCVAGLGAVLFFVKRYSSKITPQRQTIDLKAIGRVSIHKGAVYAIQAGGKTLLIGATDHSINLIADISSEQSQQVPLTPPSSLEHSIELPPETSDSLSFSSFLQSISVKGRNGKV